MPTVYLNRFDGGITNDPRTRQSNMARLVSNFDILTDPYRLSPYRDSEDGDANSSTQKIQNFALALRSGTTYSLYGLGVTPSTGIAEVYYKDLTTGAATDLDDDAWNETSNNASASGAVNFNLFVNYPRTGKMYGARAGTHIWAYDPTGSAAFADTHQALTYTSIAQGLVHPKDDILYIPYDNKIAKNNNGSWTTAALTLPTDLVVKSIADYGNFLAIGCAPNAAVGKNQVYLWDRDSSLSTLTESISWGDESLKILDEVEGELIGISLAGSVSTRIKDRIIFRRYVAGVGAVKFLELTSEDNLAELPIAKQKLNGRLYFMMSIKINGSVRTGVWSIGRTPNTREWTLVHERSVNNDSALTNGVLHNFFLVGDFLFQSYTDNAVVKMRKSNDTALFTATSIYESVKNPGMPLGDVNKKKQLKAIHCSYEPLPANGQVVVKYKVDDGSYQTIVTDTTDNSTFTEMVALSAGTQFTSGREYEFRIESTGGAVITGFSYKYENLSTNI